VLCSGGLDSSVLLADELACGHEATPIHVRCGLSWEDAEARTLARLLAHTPFAGRAMPLVTLTADVTDVYEPSHWAIVGTPPGYDTPDAAVCLTGRNLLLLTKAGIWCRRQGVSRLVIGSLAGNPFPDATREFFDQMSATLSVGLAHEICVAAPWLTLSKAQVAERGRALGVPLSLTLSCMKPGGPADAAAPCGNCSKCRERASSW
jgi:7-cyano-7-deazaguanine synthase